MDSKSVKDDLRRIMLAAAGLVAMAADEAEELVGRMVKRGELAEREAKVILEKINGNPHVARAKKAGRNVADSIGRGLKSLMSTLKSSTKEELERLSKKVDELAKRLDEEKKTKRKRS